MEAALYELLRAELPDAILVSVGHRSTLSRFHSTQLELVGEGGWEISTPRR
jgi:putative ATP-binding cassette transporter